jgi:hypothetical protein
MYGLYPDLFTQKSTDLCYPLLVVFFAIGFMALKYTIRLFSSPVTYYQLPNTFYLLIPLRLQTKQFRIAPVIGKQFFMRAYFLHFSVFDDEDTVCHAYR